MKARITPSPSYVLRLLVLYGAVAIVLGIAATLALSLFFDPVHAVSGLASFVAGAAFAYAARYGLLQKARMFFTDLAHHPRHLSAFLFD